VLYGLFYAYSGALHLSRWQHNNFCCMYPHQVRSTPTRRRDRKQSCVVAEWSTSGDAFSVCRIAHGSTVAAVHVQAWQCHAI
jgi:hypothetical protein